MILLVNVYKWSDFMNVLDNVREASFLFCLCYDIFVKNVYHYLLILVLSFLLKDKQFCLYCHSKIYNLCDIIVSIKSTIEPRHEISNNLTF